MNPWKIIALIVGLAGLVCYVIVLIDAFENEFFRGLLCLVFRPYAWWYGWTEFDHEKKWLILVTKILGPFVSAGLTQVAIYTEMDRIEAEKKSVIRLRRTMPIIET